MIDEMSYPFTFSLIIPVYNVEKYLEHCLQSVQNQTFKNFETIIINDGSTDNSSEIIEKFKNKINNLQIIHQQNKGVSHSRNIGIKHATGKWICFLDSDDYISNEYFFILNKYISDEIDIIEFNFETVDDNQKKKSDITKNVVPYFSNVAVWSKCFKKELFDNVKFPEGIIAEDYAITPYLLRQNRVLQIFDCIYSYQIRPNSYMTSKPKKIDIIPATQYLLTLFQNNNVIIKNDTKFMFGIFYHIFLCQFGKIYIFDYKTFYFYVKQIRTFLRHEEIYKLKYVMNNSFLPFKRKLLIFIRMYCPSWLLYSLRKMKIGV